MKMSPTRTVVRAAVVGLALLSLQAQAAPAYRLVDLAPDGFVSSAQAINNAGQIAGYEYLGGRHVSTAMAWNNGTRQILDPDFGAALAISGNGKIAGNWEVDNQDLGYRYAATHVNGQSTILPQFGPAQPQTFSTAVAINNAGRVALSASTGPEYYDISPPQLADWHAAVYTNGQLLDIGTLGGASSYARDMNEAGTVVGTAQRADGAYRAFVYDDAGGIRDIGTLGGKSAEALAINDLGAVVGVSEVAGTTTRHAFLYENGVMTDLGVLASPLDMDINNLGQIVSTTYAGGDGFLSYLYTGGVRYDLDTLLEAHPGYSKLRVHGMNDLGQIVGEADVEGAWTNAVLLNPVSPVPEPATWSMALAGLGVVGVALRRRREHDML